MRLIHIVGVPFQVIGWLDDWLFTPFEAFLESLVLLLLILVVVPAVVLGDWYFGHPPRE